MGVSGAPVASGELEGESRCLEGSQLRGAVRHVLRKGGCGVQVGSEIEKSGCDVEAGLENCGDGHGEGRLFNTLAIVWIMKIYTKV